MYDNLYNTKTGYSDFYQDLYTESFNKSGGPIPPSSVSYRLTETSGKRLTEEGYFRIVESSTYE